jgi:hypothetical protein
MQGPGKSLTTYYRSTKIYIYVNSSVLTAKGGSRRIKLKNGGGKTKNGCSRNTAIQLIRFPMHLLKTKNIIYELQFRPIQYRLLKSEDTSHGETLQSRNLVGKSLLPRSGDCLNKTRMLSGGK